MTTHPSYFALSYKTSDQCIHLFCAGQLENIKKIVLILYHSYAIFRLFMRVLYTIAKTWTCHCFSSTDNLDRNSYIWSQTGACLPGMQRLSVCLSAGPVKGLGEGGGGVAVQRTSGFTTSGSDGVSSASQKMRPGKKKSYRSCATLARIPNTWRGIQ